MLRAASVFLALAALIAMGTTDARAAAVVGNILDDGVTVDGGVWTTSTPTATAPPGANQYTQPASLTAGTPSAQLAANVINLSVSITKLFVPAELQFTSVHGVFPNPVFYRVNVSLTNNLVDGPHPISPVLFQLTALGGGAAPAGVRFATRSEFQPVSTYNSQYEPITNTSMLFGGSNGGGGELAPGATGVLSFGLVLTDTLNSNPFALRVTANPEPTSLALGSLALGSVVAYRRRRRKQAGQTTDSDSEPAVSIA